MDRVSDSSLLLPSLTKCTDGCCRVRAEAAADLHAAERRVRYRRGTILFYTLGTWHRGTPLPDGARRYTMHLSFRTAEATWIGAPPSAPATSPA